MATAAAEQSRTNVLLWTWVFVPLGIGVLLLEVGRIAYALSEPVGNDPTNPVIKRSAFLVPLLWLASGPFLLWRKPHEQGPRHRWHRLSVRLAWAVPCVLCFLHIALAFHLGHGWSHENAWEHTRQTGGYGDGVYVNYAFALVWLADVIWLCVAFDSYFARPRWLSWSVHLFLAFVVINAAVVFGGIGSQVRFVGWALLLACAVWSWRFNQRRQSHDAEHDSAGEGRTIRHNGP